MEDEFTTVFLVKPAKQNYDTDDYHFKIPRKYIRLGIIDPTKTYELRTKEINNIEE